MAGLLAASAMTVGTGMFTVAAIGWGRTTASTFPLTVTEDVQCAGERVCRLLLESAAESDGHRVNVRVRGCAENVERLRHLLWRRRRDVGHERDVS